MAKQSGLLKNAKEFRMRMERALPDEAERLEFFDSLEEGLLGEGRRLRLNPLRNWTPAIQNRLKELLGVQNLENPMLVDGEQVKTLGKDPLMGAGFLFVQEAGAWEAVERLDPRPGERVLDLCAAPGAKSTQILEKLKGQGWLLANEPDRKRVQKLDALVARHGALNVTLTSQYPEQLSLRLERQFDAVLVDAPCSSESFFSKRNEKRKDVRHFEVRKCALLQEKILDHAQIMAKSRARILYSTCTYSREENEDQIEKFLLKNPDWSLIEECRRWPHRDNMPGGYWALLARGELLNEDNKNKLDKEDAYPELRGPIKDICVRIADKRWNDNQDAYSIALACQTDKERRESGLGVLNLESQADAEAYLRGEALNFTSTAQKEVSENVCVCWHGLSLGVGRKVEMRLNNLLPKTLRTL